MTHVPAHQTSDFIFLLMLSFLIVLRISGQHPRSMPICSWHWRTRFSNTLSFCPLLSGGVKLIWWDLCRSWALCCLKEHCNLEGLAFSNRAGHHLQNVEFCFDCWVPMWLWESHEHSIPCPTRRSHLGWIKAKPSEWMSLSNSIW